MIKTRKNSKIVFTAAMALLLMVVVEPSFAVRKQPKAVETATNDTLSESDKLRFQYFYLGAANQQTMGHYAAAFDLLSHCLTINPNAPEAYFSRGAFYSGLKQDSLAGEDYKKAVTLSPDNNTFRERLGQYYISVGKYKEATAEYETLYSHDYNRSDVLSVLLQLYNQAKDYGNMIATLDRLETVDGASEQLTLQKMQVYDMSGDKKAAYDELKGLTERHPYDANYKVMLGNWLMNNDRKKEALKTYEGVLRDEPGNTAAQMSMLDYYKATDDTVKYENLFLKLLTSNNTPDDGKVALVRQLITNNEKQGGDSMKVIAVFNKALATPQHTSGLYQLLAAYMSLKHMPQDSIDIVNRHILNIEPDNAGARLQLIQSLWRKKDYDGVVELSRPALEYNPDEMAFCYFLGMAYVQQNKDDEALAAFKRGVSQITKKSNPDIVSDFYSIMGDLLHGKGLVKEAYAAYDSCLQWKPDNYMCLNNYAYYMSLKGDDLQKAEQMSYRTVKAEPKNTTYLDTYAWILFMQKRYEEAKIYIDQAIMNDTDSVANHVIREHAGDIHAMTGDITTAMRYWKEALSADKDNALLQRKIRQKKYIVK